jgi:MSHA biogenesis protein MshQ
VSTLSIWLVATIAVAGCKFDPNPAMGDDTPAAGDSGADEGGTPGAWLQPWMRRKSITLLAAQIEAPGNAALTNFPVVVSVDDPEINGGTVLADGSDIVFTADDATTLLDREIESFVGGKLVAWVKVPTLSATTDTKIYAYYGNPNPQGVPAAVWTEFLAVYHLQQDPGSGNPGDIHDATGNLHDGTADPSMVPSESVIGQVGNAIDFDGSNGYVDIPTSMDFGNAFTISVWMNMRNVDQIRTLVANSPDNQNTDGFRFFVNGNGSTDRTVRFETGNGSATGAAVTPANAILPDQWAHVAVVVDKPAATAAIYVNGVLANPADLSIRNDFSTSSDFELGRMEGNNQFSGQLDEVEISPTKRPVEWFQTSLNNQKPTVDFFTFGNEEQRP